MKNEDAKPPESSLDLVIACETVAKNVAAARTAQGMSQDDLATASAISRATVIQIESGESDPRLSTLVKVAIALQVSSMFLLLGRAELEAIAKTVEGDTVEALTQTLSEDSTNTMNRLLQSGFTRNRVRAVKIGASAVEAAGFTTGAITGAAIGSILVPGLGTAIGGALGFLFGARQKKKSDE